MSVYHKFDRGDLLHSVIHGRPKVVMASGTSGWRGNTGVSSSLSLYGGVRGRSDLPSGISIRPVDEVDSHSIDKVIFVTGSYPITGSVQFVKCRNAEATSVTTQVTSRDWYDEHFSPIERLYDYYSQFNPDYFTGSYDFYSLHLKQNSASLAPCVWFASATLPTLTASYTIEARVKPLAVTSSAQDFTIISQLNRFKLYITGSTGRLVFSDYGTIVSSSAALTKGVWQHVAVTVTGNSASLYVDLSNVGNFLFTGTLPAIAGALTASFLTVGADYVSSGPDMGYRGFLYETRIWDVARTYSQLSASANKTLAPETTGSSALRHYARFNDGPLSARHGFAMGSGTFEYGRSGYHGQFLNIWNGLPVYPVWHPNDDVDFRTYKTQITDPITHMRVLHVPSLFYGRQIATGSVELVCNGYSRQEIVRVLRDDGRGGLYLSGSCTRGPGGEDYKGVVWNKVGNVFYSEGLIVITDPALLDFAENRDSVNTSDLLQVTFEGETRTPTKTFMCRMATGEYNSSNNPTFHVYDDRGTISTDDDRIVPVRDDGTTYVTAVGLYNEERKLVAVAKLAQPIRNREKDKNTIRIRVDF